MKGYDVFVGSHFCFVRDADTALKYAEYWESRGCGNALFFEAEELPDRVCRYGRVLREEMLNRALRKEELQ